MDPTSGRDNDTTKSPSPPNVKSNSTNIPSQSRTTMTNSGSNQPTSRPTSQGKLSYANAAKKAVSNERLDSAASASPGAASNRQSRTRDARPANNQTTAVPAAVPKDRQATTQRKDTSKLDVELDAHPRAGQPPTDVDNTRNVAAHPISSPMPPDISAWKEARTAKREGRKVTIPAPSLDVRPSQASRNTSNNNSLGPPEPGEQAEKNESSLHQLDSSREINTTRSLAQQVHRTASVRTSAKPSTSSPPSNRPSASTTSPLPPLPAPALTETTSGSGRVHATRSMPTDGSQARSGGAPLELPHHRGEERGKTPPDVQSHTSHSATPSRLPPPVDERAAAATESVSQSLPVSVPRSLDKSVSRREGKRATEGTT
ncbi:hypothetical protein BJV77DRAFT_766227 [Russula vinacea]|nr:hypothetical protein BJV77DRAFT_766227 [Russula vinacea]